MAQSLKHIGEDLAGPAKPAPAGAQPTFREAAAAASSVESPALQLQRELEQAFAGSDERRWRPRSTLIFILVSNGLVWLALSWMLRGLV